MTEAEFFRCIEPFRDPRAWQKDEAGAWICVGSVLDATIGDATGAELPVDDPRSFKLTTLLEDQTDFKDYILLGRSYIDEKNFKAIEG